MAANTPGEKGLSSSGVIEARKAQGALTLLFRLDKANKAAKFAEEQQIKESRECIEEMNKILEKRLG